ncbi:hypothetical protein ACFORL_12575 [Legionella dresdenensis]|uniref:Coiled-coil protein n=1 Tax=Legionella dresdenensis TaxID=450200 RepID=A0ABV8CHV9_9GAMM
MPILTDEQLRQLRQLNVQITVPFLQEQLEALRAEIDNMYRELRDRLDVRLQRIFEQRHPQQAVAFINDNQNTHDRSVTLTATGSLMALDKRYLLKDDEEAAAFEEIEQLINEFDYNQLIIDENLTFQDKQVLAANFLTLIKASREITHVYTGLTMGKIFALVWRGVTDNSADCFPDDIRQLFDPDLKVAPEHLITTKKAALVEKFVEAARQFICSGGIIHKLLEALNKAHVDVVITTGAEAVMPAANSMAVSLTGMEVLKLSQQQQAELLANWHQDENVPWIHEFKNQLSPVIDSKLNEHFGVLLTTDERQEIINNLSYMPRPKVPYAKLNELADEIELTLINQGGVERKKAVQQLKAFAHASFYAESKQEECARLAEQYNQLKKVDQFINTITDSNNLRYNELKEKVSQLYISFDDVYYQQLQEQWQSLQAIENYRQTYQNQTTDSSHPVYKALIKRIRLEIEAAYKQAEPVSALHQLQTAEQQMAELSSWIKSLLMLPVQYKATGAKRISQVQDINRLLEQVGQNAVEHGFNFALTELKKDVYSKRKLIQIDHKTTGALRWFGKFQPQSRLVNAMNHVCNHHANTEDYRQLFLNEYDALFTADKAGFFGVYRNKGIKPEWSLAEIIQHAQSDNNRSRQACINLGWMDKQGKIKNEALLQAVSSCQEKIELTV